MPTTGVSAVGAVFGPDDERVASRIEIVGRHRVVQHGEPFRRNSLIHEVLLHGVGNGQQMRLMAVPQRRGKALDMADRGRAAEAFEPAAPPAGGGQRRLDDFGAVLASRARQNGERQCTDLAADSPGLGGQAKAVHFGNGGTVAFDDGGDVVAAGDHVGRHAHQLHFGAGHARGRDHLQHAARSSALGEQGGHELSRKRCVTINRRDGVRGRGTG